MAAYHLRLLEMIDVSFETQFGIYQSHTIQLDQFSGLNSICLAKLIHSLFVIKCAHIF